MRVTGQALHSRGVTQQQISYDLHETIERSEEEQIEKSHRFSTQEWACFNEKKY